MQRGHVLLAEDYEANRRVAVHMLDRLGFGVDVACNGIEALECLAQGAYDAVLMDCQMPELDGFEATRRVREIERGSERHIPILAMTAHALAGDRERCLAAGMDDYLAKPIKLKALEDLLALWVPGSDSAQ